MGPVEIGVVELDGIEQVVVVGVYQSNGAMAVMLREKESGEPFMTLSVNLDNIFMCRLKEGEFWAKTWGENETWREELMGCGLFEDMGGRLMLPPYDCVAELWRVKG